MISGCVYLIHLEPGIEARPGRIARHYVGWTELSAERRLAQHIGGEGSPFIRAVIVRGGTARVVRIWENRTREFERWLHKAHHSVEFCPVCSQRPRQPRPITACEEQMA